MKPVKADPWSELRRLTPARIALGRAGSSLPTREVLAFGLAHARARDAVHHALDVARLLADLKSAGWEATCVQSAATDRQTYLTRPDLGRRLAHGTPLDGNAPIAVALEDGLSAIAVQTHAVPLLQELRKMNKARWADVRVVIALQGRVALGDEIGERLGARLAVVLIGERPGLSSPDSLGVYLTYAPRVGRTDAERNCISNIRPSGLGYVDAAKRIDWLAGAALVRGLTGVQLKDDSGDRPEPVQRLQVPDV